MKTPICGVCLKSEILCNGCQRKIDTGELPVEAVEVSRMLYELSKSITSLENVEIKDMIGNEDVFIIITKEGDAPKVVGRNGKIVKKIANIVDKPVRVLGDSDSIEDVSRNLIAPLDIESINTVFTPEGETKKVIVDKEKKNRVPISKSLFKEVVKDLTNVEVELSFE